jgi:hypothetical protein
MPGYGFRVTKVLDKRGLKTVIYYAPGVYPSGKRKIVFIIPV